MSKLKLACWVLVLVLLVSGMAAVAWWGGLRGKHYTATATLEFYPRDVTILPAADDKFHPVEFELFCDTQKSLLKSRFVIMAALRDPRMKKT